MSAGSLYSINILFLIIFIWTPSHFWALSLYKADDYKKAKIPMMPLTNGIEKTKIYENNSTLKIKHSTLSTKIPS